MILACAGVFYVYADGPQQPDEQLPKTENPQDAAPVYRTETLSGKVVWLADALERQFGIKTVPEAKERSLALETDDGHVLPIVEDLRGRSFRTDNRLREMQVELRVRRYRRSPLIQVIRIYEVVKGAKYAIDYWCDVCAITMFEKGPCSCCQDENRLRRRRLDRQGEPAEEE